MEKVSIDIETELSEVFGERVRVEPLQQQSLSGATVIVCNMSYVKMGSEHSTKVRQTAMILVAGDLDLPEFALSPAAKGITGMLFARLGGFGGVSFPDSPGFSKEYHLHGWVEEPVRILFNEKVREYLTRETGWSIRGKSNRLIIFRHQETCPEDELNSFVESCLPIFELFQEAESKLDERPEVRRQTEATDMLEAAERMGGFIGARLKSQLEKVMVSREDLAHFEASPTPRKIPPAIQRQVLGGNLPLVFVGLLLVFAGLGVGTAILLAMPGPLRWLGIPMMVFMPLMGGVVSVLTIRHRRKKYRILKDGAFTTGQIVSVKGTDVSINNQVRHLVTIAMAGSGSETKGTCPAYGIAVDKARQLQSSNETVKVLVDPLDAKNVVCTDLLLVRDRAS